MSKRYGRNQRRKARNQIEVLRDDVKYLNDEIQNLRATGKANEQAVQDTIEVLGHYFYTLPELGSVEVKHAMDIINVCNDWVNLNFSPDNKDKARLLSTLLSLPVMRCGVHVDELRKRVFVRVLIRGNPCAEMAISQRAVESMPVDMLSRKMAKELADHIACHISKYS